MRPKKKKQLKFEALDKKGIPLQEIITVHEQFAKFSVIPENLGDGFLYEFNPVFRAVRDEYLRQGFCFTDHDFCNYYAFPLMCLDDVIDAKLLPYKKNFPWLKILEKSAPRTFTLTELKRSELQFNYLFHESAHLLAHKAFFPRKKTSELPKNASSLLRILLGEAFANTTECLSSAFAEGEIGAYFLDANCHFRANEKEARTLLRHAKKYGFLSVTKALFGAFLYANFLREELNGREKMLLKKFCGIKETSALKSLAAISLQLSEQFRTTTTQLHLLKMGFAAEDLQKMMAYDPLQKTLAEPRLLAQLDRLLSILYRFA